MKLGTLVAKEIRERPTACLAAVLTIFLGVASLVAVRHITVFSQREVARQLDTLGANILILPAASSLQDYYAADLNGRKLPEQRVAEILLAALPGVERLSPRLCVAADAGGRPVLLTGILPQSELQAQTAWQSVAMFTKRKHVGCKNAAACEKPADPSPEALATARTIEHLDPHDVVLGGEAAAAMQLKIGDTLTLLGESFRVKAVLPVTGTIDDGRVFAHLHTVQECANAGEVVSAIESRHRFARRGRTGRRQSAAGAFVGLRAGRAGDRRRGDRRLDDFG
jgi:putative ABC transport system permease protein